MRFPGISLALFVFLPAFCLCQPSIGDQPAFSASPEALQKASSGLEAGSNAVTVLFEEGTFAFDAEGRKTSHLRTIFKVWTKGGAEGWAMIEHSWSPWEEERPGVRARVINPDGSVHELDQATVADAPAKDDDDELVTDRRTVKAPLPALMPGSIVEQEIVTRQTKAPLTGGTLGYFYFGESVPVEKTRVRITVPEKSPFAYKARLLPELAIHEQRGNGTHETVFEQGPMKPLDKNFSAAAVRCTAFAEDRVLDGQKLERCGDCL